MKGNVLRERLAAGDTLYGAFVSFHSARMVEFLGLAGFDWVLLDGEHEGAGIETCYELALAARAASIGVVVRVPVNRPDVLSGYADIGVDAIIAPHVRTPEDATALVSGLRFPPVGSRGAAGSSRAAGYGLLTSAADYFTDQRRMPMPAALLEDVEAYDRLDGIAAVDGLEIACLGTGDLAASLGVPGQPGDPRIGEMVDRAVEVLTARGIHLSVAAGDPAAARRWAERGARLIMVPTVGLIASAARGFLAEARG